MHGEHERAHSSRAKRQSWSPNEHAPGPRGSPHEPHAPAERAALALLLLAATANTDSLDCSLALPQCGHAALCDP
jgi:hypothetical protein